MGWIIGVPFPFRGGEFSLHRRLQESTGIMQPSLQIKRLELEADQSILSTGKVKNVWNCSSFSS
jgi:hypothetical protein